MNYKSTRNTSLSYSFSDVLLAGLAPDKGLFVPDYYPKVDIETLHSWKTLSYAELAFCVCRLFIGHDYSDTDLKQLLNKTYTKAVFGSQDIVPIESLSDGIYLMDLSSGPSLAFKDMAMQLLGHFISFELQRQNKDLVILGASSGDTVSAAEEAMRVKNV